MEALEKLSVDQLLRLQRAVWALIEKEVRRQMRQEKAKNRPN